MENEIENRIYVDPLTGLPNFFKFIKCDTLELLKENGCIAFIDINGFRKLNESYGKDIGDACLLNLVDSIKNQAVNIEASKVFRTHGDEFLLIMPRLSYKDGEKIIELISSEFADKNAIDNIDALGIHSLVFEYKEKIESISELFKRLLDYSIKKDNNLEGSQKKWFNQFIDSLIKRISETLLLINNTYYFALTDDTTGLYNNKAARMYLNSTMAGLKAGEKLSILFIDGDELKRYNNISYDCGNEMIKKLSMVIANAIRKVDKVYRWFSGDEFVIILKNTDQIEAKRLGERIRKAVEKESKNWLFPVTVSVGVSTLPDDGDDINKIIKNAENANASAKASGKNVVVVWEQC